MNIAIGCDHAGYKYKAALIEYMKELGHSVEDFGCMTEGSVDYADYASPVALSVAEGKAERGVLICHSGVGMSMCANKISGIRCALCSEPVSAKLSRAHNDANILALGAGMIGLAMAKEMLLVWLDTAFEGGRHQRRIDKISVIEKDSLKRATLEGFD